MEPEATEPCHFHQNEIWKISSLANIAQVWSLQNNLHGVANALADCAMEPRLDTKCSKLRNEFAHVFQVSLLHLLLLQQKPVSQTWEDLTIRSRLEFLLLLCLSSQLHLFELFTRLQAHWLALHTLTLTQSLTRTCSYAYIQTHAQTHQLTQYLLALKETHIHPHYHAHTLTQTPTLTRTHMRAHPPTLTHTHTHIQACRPTRSQTCPHSAIFLTPKLFCLKNSRLQQNDPTMRRMFKDFQGLAWSSESKAKRQKPTHCLDDSKGHHQKRP